MASDRNSNHGNKSKVEFAPAFTKVTIRFVLGVVFVFVIMYGMRSFIPKSLLIDNNDTSVLCTQSVCAETAPCPFCTKETCRGILPPCPTVDDLCTADICSEQLPSHDNAIVTCTAEQCRSKIFVTQGQGGAKEIPATTIDRQCGDALVYGVCDELQVFTGLSDAEHAARMQRRNRFHFEGEHMFWNPMSATELAWYYTHSVDYLFANSIHPAPKKHLSFLTPDDGPVLDYSGGVGNCLLYLLEKDIQVQYFGIGQLEKSFAEFRFDKRGYLDSGLATIKKPWSAASEWAFDPVSTNILPRDGSLGAILAMDVLEHIPHYHLVVKAMVDSIRVGGYIVESTPFGSPFKGTDAEEDVRVHVGDGGIGMAQAMGEQMQKVQNGRWLKLPSKRG